jgi:hypothetical protein
MFAKSSFLGTIILSFILMLVTSPLFASTLPISSPISIASPAPLAMPQAHIPTSLMGRTIILRSAGAEAEEVDNVDAIPNRAERFALRMKHAGRLA